MNKNDGFIAMDVLFSLFILTLIGLLFTYSIKNNSIFLAKNNKVSDLRLEAQNVIDSINFDERDMNRRRLEENNEIYIELNNGSMKISKEILSSNLWRLSIEVIDNYDGNTHLRWVTVVEG